MSLLIGLDVSASAAAGADPVRDARDAESAGFDLVSVNDHPATARPTFECWTLLTWIAASTAKIRIAPRVLGVPYRSPAMVAKMAEGLSRLSGGRLILGLGAGASDEQLRAFGLAVLGPGEKVRALEEAVVIARGLWSESRFGFEGTRHRVEDAPLEPKPAHPIPIWLGTLGPRGLQATGRVGDGWIPSFELAPPERIRGMRDVIARAAGSAGRDLEEITCVYNIAIHVGEPSEEPGVLSGEAARLAERLLRFTELGFSGFNLVPTGPDRREQVRRLATGVLPLLR